MTSTVRPRFFELQKTEILATRHKNDSNRFFLMPSTSLILKPCHLTLTQ